MKRFGLGTYALSGCVAVALLAGCGGSQLPTGAPGAMPQTSAIATHVDRGTSWMLPGLSGRGLLYVVMRVGAVDILSYPACKKLGTLQSAKRTAAPVISNPVNGDILINVRGTLDEYAHGGQRPIAQIHPTPSYGIAGHYAFDPISQNIAVSFQSNFGSQSGLVAVYQTPSSNPIVYTVPNMLVPAYLGYDNQGNLFVDGKTSANGSDIFAELPNGASKFGDISLNQTMTNMGSIQWDGSYITLANNNTIYQIQLSGSTGSVVGQTTLEGAWAQYPAFWIQDGTVLGDHLSKTHLHNGRLLGLWHYPKGGASYKVIDYLSTRNNNLISSEAVSMGSQ
jgi:hypothetical protein